MRPNEVCQVRPCDVDRSGKVWTYAPAEHKTEHHGKGRVILIGPRGQDILRPYLLRPHGEYCFRPSRGTLNPTKDRRYRVDSYGQAIQRACDRAHPAPKGMEGEQLKAWRTEHRWSPNRLRHTFATEARAAYGLEAAQVLLGHSSADITQVYAERDLSKGLEVAAKIG
jgi:integrase